MLKQCQSLGSVSETISIHAKNSYHVYADINRTQIVYSSVGCLVAVCSNYGFPPARVGSCSIIKAKD